MNLKSYSMLLALAAGLGSANANVPPSRVQVTWAPEQQLSDVLADVVRLRNALLMLRDGSLSD